jgi:hypothetical protein
MAEFLERLTKALFTGELTIRFNRGTIVAAKLTHSLANDEFQKPIPVVEEDFKLTPAG